MVGLWKLQACPHALPPIQSGQPNTSPSAFNRRTAPMMTVDDFMREQIRADPTPEAILIKAWEIEWDGSRILSAIFVAAVSFPPAGLPAPLAA